MKLSLRENIFDPTQLYACYGSREADPLMVKEVLGFLGLHERRLIDWSCCRLHSHCASYLPTGGDSDGRGRRRYLLTSVEELLPMKTQLLRNESSYPHIQPSIAPEENEGYYPATCTLIHLQLPTFLFHRETSRPQNLEHITASCKFNSRNRYEATHLH